MTYAVLTTKGRGEYSGEHHRCCGGHCPDRTIDEIMSTEPVVCETMEEISESGWRFFEGRLYCPDCAKLLDDCEKRGWEVAELD